VIGSESGGEYSEDQDNGSTDLNVVPASTVAIPVQQES